MSKKKLEDTQFYRLTKIYLDLGTAFVVALIVLMIVGTFIFSVSIYCLAFQDAWGVNLKFLGPITPLGGLFMIISWGMLIWYFAKAKF